MEEDGLLKGRGAQGRYQNRFDQLEKVWIDGAEPEGIDQKTSFIKTYPKKVINKVDSPDIPFGYSMNPYQGCEHGCTYCYARNTHEYWGYGPGIDFEQKILVKQNFAALLKKELSKKSWKAAPIMLSGNTDCYQPIERSAKVTRSILEVLNELGHPVGIITKNKLILRDLDILKSMAQNGLVRVAISITSYSDKIRQKLEPRASSIPSRIDTIKQLSDNGISVNAMMAPIIPSINDHEIAPLMEACAQAGADDMNYTVVRLNGAVGLIFREWLLKAYPDRADRVWNQIASFHSGSVDDNRFGLRMTGEGNFSDMVRQNFKLFKKKYFGSKQSFKWNLELFEQRRNPQMKLF